MISVFGIASGAPLETIQYAVNHRISGFAETTQSQKHLELEIACCSRPPKLRSTWPLQCPCMFNGLAIVVLQQNRHLAKRLDISACQSRHKKNTQVIPNAQNTGTQHTRSNCSPPHSEPCTEVIIKLCQSAHPRIRLVLPKQINKVDLLLFNRRPENHKLGSFWKRANFSQLENIGHRRVPQFMTHSSGTECHV